MLSPRAQPQIDRMPAVETPLIISVPCSAMPKSCPQCREGEGAVIPQLPLFTSQNYVIYYDNLYQFEFWQCLEKELPFLYRLF